MDRTSIVEFRCKQPNPQISAEHMEIITSSRRNMVYKRACEVVQRFLAGAHHQMRKKKDRNQNSLHLFV